MSSRAGALAADRYRAASRRPRPVHAASCGRRRRGGATRFLSLCVTAVLVCPASGRSATACTSAHAWAGAAARSRGRAYPRDGSAGCAPAPSSRRPKGRSVRWLAARSRSRSANGGSAVRGWATKCTGTGRSKRGRRFAADARSDAGAGLVRCSQKFQLRREEVPDGDAE